MIDLTVNNKAVYVEDDLTLTAHVEEGRECAHCGEAIAEYVDGWTHDDTGTRWCGNLTDDEAADDDGATLAAPAAAVPGNWAGITTSVEDESVRVEISVADPRGCLTMTLRRVRAEDGTERLLLHVPHPEDSTPHVALREIAPGTYEIG